ncbi:alkaline phosphatase-like [Ornithodoros turicata]
MNCITLCATLGVLVVSTVAAGRTFRYDVPNRQEEEDVNHWSQLGLREITSRNRHVPNTRKARNLILFLGDGMGPSTVTAARIYKGQRVLNVSGEEATLSWDEFPHVSLSRTYGLDVQTSDSANTATAYLCGIKANFETLGVNYKIKSHTCHSDTATHVPSIMAWAQKEGLWTGVVTTTRITHATPAGSYAHSGHRDWEAAVPEGCVAKDIAQQLIQDSPGLGFRVIMGGGRKMFLGKDATDDEGLPGVRPDGKDLIKEWVESRKAQGNAAYIWNRKQLLSLDTQKTDFVLGLFANNHVPYAIDRINLTEPTPSLPEMTKAAIEILNRSPRGFVLLVEGGRIDHAHHDNKGAYALEETVEMDQAVAETKEFLSTDDTLIVVTADHSHVFTVGGYPERGKNILGISSYSDMDHYPVTTLAYANGPGYNETKVNYTDYEATDPHFVQRTIFPLQWETHGGEEVAVYAEGPWAHLFSGVHDQSYIPHAMAYAACIGQFAGASCELPSSATLPWISTWGALAVFLVHLVSTLSAWRSPF